MSLARAPKLSELVGGAAEERFADALERILENIADPNTDAEAARKLTMELTFKPAKSRERFDLSVVVKTKTAVRSAVSTVVFFGRRPDGMWEASEYVPPTQRHISEALAEPEQAPAPMQQQTAGGAVVPGRFDGRK